MSEPLATYQFLSWLRRGVSSEITRPDRDAASVPRAVIPIVLSFNAGLSASASLSLYGPGEVTGFDRRAVIRTWPRADVASAEPNYFPLIEFDQADLPWRYTPAPASDDHLRPWLCLIALRDDEIERQERAGLDRPLPVVTVKSAAALPRLSQSWAWAHAQVSGVDTVDQATAARILANEPTRMVSRLLCPRRLDPRTPYTAFLVPSFERGRLAGLGRAVDEAIDGMAPAWSDDVTMIELPVYYHWRFQTGVAGDFEYLVRQLRARALPPTVGVRPMDVSTPDPDSAMPAAAPGALGLEGALKAPSTATTEWPPEQAERQRFTEALQMLLNRPAELRQNRDGELAVAPPLYGQGHAARDTLDLGVGAQPPWFHELNADPRWRVTAGLGTRVVQREQQALMAGAWSQAEGIRTINEELQRAQLAREAADRVFARHIAPLDDETRLHVLEPILGRILASPVTVQARLRASPIAVGALDPQWRRVARPFGPVGRRQGRSEQPRVPTFLRRMNRGALSAAPSPSTPAGMATPARTGASLVPGWARSGLRSRLRPASRWGVVLGVVCLLGAALVFTAGASAGPTALMVVIGAGALVGAWVVRRIAADLDRRAALRDGTLTPELIAGVPARSDFVAAEAPWPGHGPGSPPSRGEPT